MRNRIPRIESFLPPSPGDKLLSSAHSAKLELIRYTHDDEPQVGLSFEVCGTITDGAEAQRLLRALLESFQGPPPELEGGVS
jgi:hypothetical protein